MSNRSCQENNFYRPQQYGQQNQINYGPQHTQFSSYSVLPNNTYYNSQQSQVYHDYMYSKNIQHSSQTSMPCQISYDKEWLPDPRIVSDIEKGLRLTDKIETIEITSKDLSPASCCSNFDLLLHDYYNNKNYTEYPSCSQVFSNDQLGNKTVKYCSIQKPNNYDCSYIQSTDCFQDVFQATSDICSDVLNFDPVGDRIDGVSEDSDIIVEDLDDEEYLEETEEPDEEEAQRKFNCLLCNVEYSPVGSQFYFLTAENPLTMSSQKSVSEKLKSIVGDFKDSYLCSQCLGLINTIDHLEMKLENCKHELVQNFQKSNNTSGQVKSQERKSSKCKHKLRCKVCRRTVALVDIYRNHMARHKLPKRFLCEICGKRFGKIKIFHMHIKNHKGVKSSSEHIQGHCCKICKKAFRTMSNLKEHENYCSGKLPFICTKCHKKFASTTKLKSHIKLKHEKKFTAICSICNIGFVQISDYKRHMISHSTLKKFNCTQCDKSYKTLSNLNFHMKFHDKKLPFICQTCSKGFMRKEYLESHKASHTGEKNFACAMCEMKFASQKNLDAHLKYHNGGINKKSCNICGKIISKIALEDHLRTHSNLKEFKCDKCDLTFNTKSGVQKHRKRKHQES